MGVVVRRYIYRFLHTTYPHSSCICSFLQQHPYFFHKKICFLYCIAVDPPPWPALFATSHHSLDREAFYIQSHLITKNSVDFFVSTGFIYMA